MGRRRGWALGSGLTIALASGAMFRRGLRRRLPSPCRRQLDRAARRRGPTGLPWMKELTTRSQGVWGREASRLAGMILPAHASFLGSPVFWTIVGVAVAVAVGVGVLTVWVTVRSRPKTRLAYDAQATAVVSDQAAGRVEVVFDRQPVKNVSLVDVTIANTGNTALRPEDFVRPLHIVLPAGATPLSLEVTHSEPPDLGATASIQPDADPVVDPMLMNPGDGLTISVLVANFPGDGEVTLSGRVAGVEEFDRATESGARMLAQAARIVTSLSIAGVTIDLSARNSRG